MQEEAEKTVPLEVQQHVKHHKRGILSMGRMDDPDSGQSSFSILLGPAPHLDMHYTIWGYGKASQQTPNCLPADQSSKRILCDLAGKSPMVWIL